MLEVYELVVYSVLYNMNTFLNQYHTQREL